MAVILVHQQCWGQSVLVSLRIITQNLSRTWEETPHSARQSRKVATQEMVSSRLVGKDTLAVEADKSRINNSQSPQMVKCSMEISNTSMIKASSHLSLFKEARKDLLYVHKATIQINHYFNSISNIKYTIMRITIYKTVTIVISHNSNNNSKISNQ